MIEYVIFFVVLGVILTIIIDYIPIGNLPFKNNKAKLLVVSIIFIIIAILWLPIYGSYWAFIALLELLFGYKLSNVMKPYFLKFKDKLFA